MAEPVSSGSNRVVVDWDGTIVAPEWPGHPEVMLEGAPEALRALLTAGYEVVVSSTRLAPRALDEVTQLTRADREKEARYIRRVLDSYDLHDVHIWRKPWKPGAVRYIDDRAVRFDGDWGAVLKEVLA